MANPEHLNFIQQGIESWNEWKEKNPASLPDLSGADLSGANLSGADLSGAYLRGADLIQTRLIDTDFRQANLTGSSIYGIAAWDVKLNAETQQQNLIITPRREAVIMVDNIKVAQFIYLLLNNQEIREVIDTITSKGV